MVDEVELEVGGVGPGHLGQPGDGLGGQLYHGQVQGVGLGQAVVPQVVPKPADNQLRERNSSV